MKSVSPVADGALARFGLGTVADGAAALNEPAVQVPAQRRFPHSGQTAAAIGALRLSELVLHYDKIERILWCDFDYSGRPCFTPTVLEQTQQVQNLVRSIATGSGADDAPLRYVVLGSRTPGIWNLGGDLQYFVELIRNRDRAALTRYAHVCCELTFTNATVFDLPVVSIALVQGDALGGGFEAVLSFNHIIAERSTKFGLPETLFNLFPGMGAYTFLSRRVAPGLAERMILSGEIYSAEELYELGVIDVLAADGEGSDALYAHIGRDGRRHRSHAAMREARRIASPISRGEMMRIADLWVDAAMTLSEADLRKMTRLAAAQDRRRNRAPLATTSS